jgi:hypothetical protein
MAVLKTKLDGWITPPMETLNLSPFAAFIAKPNAVLEAMEGPQVFIWNAKASIHRTTAPRSPGHTGGFKRAPWKVSVFLFFIDAPQPSDTTWNMIKDSLRWGIEDIVYPQTITDLDSQPQVTQLIEIGENIDMEAADPEPIAEQGQLLYTAHLIVDMIEDYQS